MFHRLRFCYFRPFWPCSRGRIYIILGHFGHVQGVAFLLLWAVRPMFGRLHCYHYRPFLAMFKRLQLYHFKPFW